MNNLELQMAAVTQSPPGKLLQVKAGYCSLLQATFKKNFIRADTAMTIHYKNTLGDLAAFHIYNFSRNPTFCLAGFAFIAIISYAIFMGSTNMATFAVREVIVLAIIAAFIAFGFFMTTFPQIFRVQFSITTGEDGFIFEMPNLRKERKWSDIKKLARLTNHIFIYFGPYNAYVVPRRAFKDAQEWDSFYEFCRQKAVAAQGTKLP